MNGFREIDIKELQDNVVKLIGSDWMLITAGDAEKQNTMTASWGPKPENIAYFSPLSPSAAAESVYISENQQIAPADKPAIITPRR